MVHLARKTWQDAGKARWQQPGLTHTVLSYSASRSEQGYKTLREAPTNAEPPEGSTTFLV